MNVARYFNPATDFMDRLKYPQKFALISVLFAAPLAVMMVLLFAQLQEQVGSSRRELQGTEYLKTLRQLWISLPQLNQTAIATEGQGSSEFLRLQSQVSKDLRNLDRVDRTLGPHLQTTQQYKELSSLWNNFQTNQQQWSPETRQAVLQDLSGQVDRLRKTVGNQSGLILDPLLDSYYLMDASLTEIPKLQQQLADVKVLGQGVMVRKRMTSGERGQLLSLVGLLRATSEDLDDSLATAWNQDPALRKTLEPQLQLLQNQVQVLVSSAESLLYEYKIPEPDQYYDLADASLQSSQDLWDQSTTQLEILLHRRIEQMNQRRMLILGFVIVMLATVLYAFVGFYRGVMRTVSSLSQTSRQMLKGEVIGTVALTSRDELSEVVRSFNRLATALVSSNQEITALNGRLKDENTRMGTELDVTRRLQEMVLPKEEELQKISPLDISGYMKPATEVGGDYYDVLHHNGHVKLGIGDVTGHGLESGMLMIMVQTAVRTLLESEVSDPLRFMDILNRTIYGNVQRMQSDKNLTLALVDYQDGVMKLTGQHEELLLVRSSGRVERIDTIDLGFPIGLEENISDFIANTQVTLDAGDGVVLYTDGITEAENSKGLQYGLDRLCAIVSQHWQKSADVIRQAVVDDLYAFIGEHHIYDDITLLVCKQR
jgi:serine phosphatase RsbU (regulator of sigma subunit)/molybdopterin converting factor small subunit